MEPQSVHNSSEKTRLYEDEEETRVHLEKLNSFWYVLFKYWMLICALWTLKNLILSFSSSSSDSLVVHGIKVENSPLNTVLDFLEKYPLKVWAIINCALVFEGLRRKNLKIMLKAISFMEAYVFVEVVTGFMSLTSEASITWMKAYWEKKFDSKPGSGSMTLFAVVILLVWVVYYHLAYIYGTKKSKDALKAHYKIRCSL